MIYRRKLRSIYNATEATSKTDSIASDALAFVFTTAEALYLGFHEKFACRYFYLGTLNTNAAVLTIKYWDGSAYSPVEDKVDQTEGLTKSGWLSWKNVSGWAKSTQAPVVDEQLYWIKITTSANFSAGTTIKAILNLFSDAVLLREYYPELISDTRYLPSDRTDFIEQYHAAKNMVVQELIRIDKIKDESQVLNPEVVAIASAHASAYCILNGIPNASEDLIARKKAVFADFEFWIERSKLSLDLDNSGELEEVEENVGTQFFVRR